MKIKGLKKVCGESRKVNDIEKDGKRLWMVYNLKTKEVYTVESSSGIRPKVNRKDKNLITVGVIKQYISMETIKHMVFERVRKHENYKKKVEEWRRFNMIRYNEFRRFESFKEIFSREFKTIEGFKVKISYLKSDTIYEYDKNNDNFIRKDFYLDGNGFKEILTNFRYTLDEIVEKVYMILNTQDIGVYGVGQGKYEYDIVTLNCDGDIENILT